jgi:hypothetical protein
MLTMALLVHVRTAPVESVTSLAVDPPSDVRCRCTVADHVPDNANVALPTILAQSEKVFCAVMLFVIAILPMILPLKL